QFTRDAIGSLLTFSLVKSLSDAAALAAPLRPAVRLWVLEMERATKAMRAGSISQKQWQQGIEELLARVSLADLLRAIDYDALVRRAVFQPVHETVLDVDLGGREGVKNEMSFNSYFYAMKKGTNIVPHGHTNMATMHVVLSGEARALHYDRVGEDGHHLMIKPVSDVLAKAGDASTVSDESTNIHWFETTSERLFMFNIGVFGLDSTKAITGREYVDPLHGERAGGEVIRAPRLTHEQAYRLYSGR
ncbi:MAG TPA: hypothetical protein VJZ91_05570, partial [Blastocatellia bacterium]|nr:hypothetical protein [Blastocatellia bacterium]